MESKEKFTPGPWVAVQGPEDKPNKVYVERETSYAGRKYKKQFLIATLPSHQGAMYVEDLANLALVAAAPRMYNLLQSLLDHLPSVMAPQDDWEEQKCGLMLSTITRELAKARGEKDPYLAAFGIDEDKLKETN